nr:phosphoprotein [Orthoavulavirus newyorkense]
MASFTDDEISDLMEQSGLVIDEIMTSQGMPKETLGRSAIPPGKTQALTDAWEKHNKSQRPDTDHITGSNDKTDVNIPHNTGPPQSASDPSPPAEVESDTTPTQKQDTTERHPCKEGATGGLLDMLDRIAAKQDRAKKGLNPRPQDAGAPHSGQLLTQMPDSTSRRSTNPSGRSLESGTPAQLSTLRRDDSPYQAKREEEGIAENTAWSGAQTGLSPSAGATQFAPQSPTNQGNLHAHAGTALQNADFVQALMGILESIQQRVSKMEYQMDLALRHLSSMPAIRNDIQQVKTAMAVLEANIGMMKILDPGSAHISSLNDLRAVARSHPVLVAGPGDPNKTIADDQTITVNRLSQPVTDQRSLVRELTPPTGDFEAEKCAIKALLAARPLHPSAAKRMSDRLDAAKTCEELRKVKRQILNN